MKQLDKFRKEDLYSATIGAFKVLGVYEGTTIVKINDSWSVSKSFPAWTQRIEEYFERVSRPWRKAAI